ncbi:hypothetical protein Tco_1429332 [Tanacetum coccineum]
MKAGVKMGGLIVMANPLPPNHIANQPDLAYVILEPALVNQEEDEDEADPLNPPPPASDSETEDMVKSEDMVEPENVKVDAYIRGLPENIKGEVTSSNPTNLGEAVRMADKLMDQKLQARNERAIEGNKRKWENYQRGSSRSNYQENNRNSQQNYQRQGNARAMTNAPNERTVLSAPAPTCARCGSRHYDRCPP